MDGQAGQTETKKWYRRTDRGARIPLALFMPLLLIFMCQAIMLQSFPEAWGWLMSNPMATLWTYLVLLLVEVLVERLSRSLLCGALVIVLPCFLLAVASHLKLATNGVPLLFSDLVMIGQAAQIAGFLNPEMGIGAATWGAIFLALAILFLIFLWNRPAGKEPVGRRLCAAALAAFALALTLAAPGTGAFLEDPKEGTTQAERNDRLGVLGGMCAAVRNAITAEPDVYSEENMNRILLEISAKAPKVTTPREKPNVVVLVSESFFDPTRLPNVTYSTDPVPNYHKLGEDFPTGMFLSNTFAGGTGGVEVEIITGIPTTMINDSELLTSISGEGVYERVPSVVKAFASQGYATTYVHSHDDHLYERPVHYPQMGFEKMIFRDDFTVDVTYAGPYASDDCWADQLIAEFEAKEEGKPLFLFGMSMENHQAYTAAKYSEPSPVTFTSPYLDEAAAGVFDSLVHGLYDADASLGKVIDYFSTVDEPTIVVFVGDHLPRPVLGENDTIYDRLGYSTTAVTANWEGEELKRMVSTNYLIWNNYDADLEIPQELSSMSLGTWLLEWAGMPKPLYFYWVDTVLKDVAFVRPRLCVTADGKPTHDPPQKVQPILKRYSTIVYDILYGRQFAASALTGSSIRQTVHESMPEVVTPPPMDDE